MRKPMWKTLLLLGITLSFAQISFAEEFKCGVYEFKGVIKKSDGINVLKLYEGTMSETVFTLAPDLQELAEIYVDQAVTLQGKLFKPVDKYRGKIESLLSENEIRDLTGSDKPYSARFMRDDIKERVPDPLHPEEDSEMKLIKYLSCDSRAPSSKKVSDKKTKKK